MTQKVEWKTGIIKDLCQCEQKTIKNGFEIIGIFICTKSFCYCACQFLSPFCKVIAQKSAIFFGPNSTADAQRVSSSRGSAEGHVCCSPLEQKGGEDFPNLTRKGVFASVPLNNRAVKIFLI